MRACLVGVGALAGEAAFAGVGWSLMAGGLKIEKLLGVEKSLAPGLA